MDYGNLFALAFEQAIGPTAVIYCLAAVGLNVHFGYTGLLNFGQAGFMAVAGYALAASVASWGIGFWWGLLLGLAGAIVLALLLGFPTLKLRADYLAIVTIAGAEIIRIVIGSVTLRDTFGGQDGLGEFAGSFQNLNPFHTPMGGLGLSWSPYDFWVMLVGWIVVALCCFAIFLLMRSPWGRVLKSIREDEDAVRSLGKNVYGYKMQSLIIGGLIGALAGFTSALAQASIQPLNFASDTTFFAYTILLVGGAARVLGPVVGTMIFWFLLQFLDLFFGQASKTGLIPSSIMTVNQASLIRFIVMGLALMLLMIFRPQGIFGDRREIAIDAR
ncbi:MAG: branched-chain amino acid ABC transporter permease [Nocardioidaceae bacterium]